MTINHFPLPLSRLVLLSQELTLLTFELRLVSLHLSMTRRATFRTSNVHSGYSPASTGFLHIAVLVLLCRAVVPLLVAELVVD